MLAMLGLQIALAVLFWGLGIAFTGPVATFLKLGFVWIAISATIQRLHDVGLSGWWMLWGFLGLVVWAIIVPVVAFLMLGPEAFNPASYKFFLLIGVVYIPLLALAFWMHLAKGDTDANRFGPAPDASGFSNPATRNRPVDAGEALAA